MKRNRSNYEVSIYHSKNSKPHYNNLIDRDPNKLAQILIDLYLEGFPIEKAIIILEERFKKRDWLGI